MPPQGSHLAAPFGGRLGGLRFHVAAWQRESTAPRRKGAPWTAEVDKIDAEIHAPLRVFKKPCKTYVNSWITMNIPDQLLLKGAYWLSRLFVHVVRCCSSSVDRCRCMWRLVRLSDHLNLLRTVTFLDAPDGEALELDVSRQIWEQIPRCLWACFLKPLNPHATWGWCDECTVQGGIGEVTPQCHHRDVVGTSLGYSLRGSQMANLRSKSRLKKSDLFL